MKNVMKAKGILWLLVMVACPVHAGRVWVEQPIESDGSVYFDCGNTPSMALLYGVQPVISNYNSAGQQMVVRRTPFGWEEAAMVPAYIGGDGGQNLVSNFTSPLTYGQDGHFYSFTQQSYPDYVTIYQHGVWVSVGPELPSGLTERASASADHTGRMYVAHASNFWMSNGGNWQEPTDPDWDGGSWQSFSPIDTVSQLAVSPYGEVALSGYGGSTRYVVWYDYKSSSWHSRGLGGGGRIENSIAVSWDSTGNLGVAYSRDNYVYFEYLNMSTDLWEIDVLAENSYGSPYQGAALAFDRFDNPVVASGSSLFYDPVPEPATLLFFALVGLRLSRKRSHGR